MFNLDLKRAETALAAGRLEDAYQVLAASPKTRHADGQRLIDQLVLAFLDRGQQHLEQSRFEAARADAKRAQRLGGGQLKVARLLQQIAAKDQSRVGHLREDAAQQAADQLTRLITAQQHSEAVKLYAGHQDRVASSEQRTLIEPSVQHLQTAAAADLNAGRLDRCQATLRLLTRARCDGPATLELQSQLQRCREVQHAIEQANYPAATRALKLLAQVAPSATWASDAIESLEQCVQSLTNVQSGPLGLLAAGVASRSAKPRWRTSAKPNIAHPNQFSASAAMNADLPADNAQPAIDSPLASLLHVDQLGSLLLLQGNTFSIGSISCERRNGPECDIVLQTEGPREPVIVHRDGEHYFASSRRAFFVNDLLAERHLLSDGDTIKIGSRGQLKFCQRVAASSTAVLQIKGSRMRRRDVRSIVLLDDAVLFGSDNSHFRVGGLDRRIVVRPADGTGRGDLLLHQQGQPNTELLQIGGSVTVGTDQFTLAEFQPTNQPSGGIV